MTDKKTRERPLGLDIDPDEAFERFLGVDPDEIDENKKLKKRPPPKRGPVVEKREKPKHPPNEPD